VRRRDDDDDDGEDICNAPTRRRSVMFSTIRFGRIIIRLIFENLIRQKHFSESRSTPIIFYTI